MSASNAGKGSKPPPRLDRWYPGDPPRPIPWWSYPNPRVVEAVELYLYLVRDGHGWPAIMMVKDGAWLRAYLQYFVDCPRQDLDQEELAELRKRAHFLGDRRQVGDWLQDALAVGLDVLGNP